MEKIRAFFNTVTADPKTKEILSSADALTVYLR